MQTSIVIGVNMVDSKDTYFTLFVGYGLAKLSFSFSVCIVKFGFYNNLSSIFKRKILIIYFSL
jgi:hypothetical protein